MLIHRSRRDGTVYALVSTTSTEEHTRLVLAPVSKQGTFVEENLYNCLPCLEGCEVKGCAREEVKSECF